MPSFRIATACGSAALAAVLIGGGAALPRPALALDDDGKANVFTGLLSLIDINPFKRGQSDINYRERAPLVLPPKMDLPPPGQAQEQPAPGWPQDPDVLRRKKAAEESLLPTVLTRQGQAEKLRGEELAGPGAGARGEPTEERNPGMPLRGCPHGRCNWVSPDALQAQGAAAAKGFGNDGSDTVVAGQEPERRYLTEPPKGYRKATQTVKATNDGPKVIQQNNDNSLDFWKSLNPFKSSDDDD